MIICPRLGRWTYIIIRPWLGQWTYIIICPWLGQLTYIIVTECIVCVSGYDPLTFSFLSFSFLIGWEFYGPNYLKC